MTSGYYQRPDEDPPDGQADAGGYRLWVDADGTLLVRMWASGTVEVATRTDSSETWGPPVELNEAKV